MGKNLGARHLSICPMLLVLFTLASAAAYVLPSCSSVRSHTARVSTHVSMDETIMQKALAGELEEEGAENVFMSEVGWASYLDKEAKSSYNMNQRPSMADDGYFTPSIFSNPLDVLVAWKDALFGAASNPLETAFPTIKPKTKDFDPNKRIVGIPGFNAFGAPSSKS